MIFVYPLTKEERDELQRVMKLTPSEKWRQRLAIIELSSQGYAASTLARMFHMSGNTVRNYINSYNAGGINALIPKAIGPKSIIYQWRVKELSGREIKENRQKYGLSQEVLAALLNVMPSTVDGWENGKVKPNKVSLIAMQLLFDKMKKGYRPFIDVREISGKEIRRKREKCGLTREMMAALIGVCRQTVYKWENGAAKPSKPSIIVMRTLFEKLEKDYQAFIRVKELTGEEIKSNRESFGLSQEAMAALLDVSRTIFIKWEKGEAKPTRKSGLALQFLFDKLEREYRPFIEEVCNLSGKDIREKREKYRLSQEVIAALLDVSPSIVNKWEKGVRQPKYMSALALKLLFEKLEEGYSPFRIR